MFDITSLCYVVLLIIIILILTYKWSNSPLRNTIKYKLPDDTNQYFVQEQYKDKEEAARMMSVINQNIMKLLKALKTKRETGQYDDNPYVKGVVERVLRNWNPEVLYESPPTLSTTSYTIAKGEKTVFCLRDKEKQSLHQLDDMLYVALHELSHMGDLKWGHNYTFWEVFKFILTEAKSAGIYEPIDYSQEPITYCGLRVNYNPYFDITVKDINQG
jgi:hypothetical protein